MKLNLSVPPDAPAINTNLKPGETFNPYRQLVQFMVPVSLPALVGTGGLSWFDLVLYGRLQLHKAPGAMTCWVKRETLAGELNTGLDTVDRGLSALKRAGLLKATRRGRGRENEYAFLWSDALGASLRKGRTGPDESADLRSQGTDESAGLPPMSPQICGYESADLRSHYKEEKIPEKTPEKSSSSFVGTARVVESAAVEPETTTTSPISSSKSEETPSSPQGSAEPEPIHEPMKAETADTQWWNPATVEDLRGWMARMRGAEIGPDRPFVKARLEQFSTRESCEHYVLKRTETGLKFKAPGFGLFIADIGLWESQWPEIRELAIRRHEEAAERAAEQARQAEDFEQERRAAAEQEAERQRNLCPACGESGTIDVEYPWRIGWCPERDCQHAARLRAERGADYVDNFNAEMAALDPVLKWGRKVGQPIKDRKLAEERERTEAPRAAGPIKSLDDFDRMLEQERAAKIPPQPAGVLKAAAAGAVGVWT